MTVAIRGYTNSLLKHIPKPELIIITQIFTSFNTNKQVLTFVQSSNLQYKNIYFMWRQIYVAFSGYTLYVVSQLAYYNYF